MRVRVRFFAGTRDAVGANALDVDVPDGTRLADLITLLESSHPRLAAYRDCALLAVDGALAPPETRLAPGSEVALMPPVSGGSGALRTQPVTAQAAIDMLSASGSGAIVTFVGVARPPAVTLRFDAYEPMAEAELARVRTDAIAKFSLLDCALLHRVGDVPTGEPIVVVAVAARHRREAFEAVAWTMDELKTRVPIWKQEIAPDGTARWVNDPTSET